MENSSFLKEQIITYLGNKRRLLKYIDIEVQEALKKLGKDKAVTCDMFSGSGIVARMLKQYSSVLYANDLEAYSYVINDCYLTNKSDFDEATYETYKKMIQCFPSVTDGVISTNYAPKDDNDIHEGERVFYTHANAVRIDTINKAADILVEEKYKNYFLAPLLYEASVHTNTSGVFKGFYKSKETKIGKFGGDGENAIERITGAIAIKKPVFSNYECAVKVYREDANDLVKVLKGLDITYIDPPYNQHPYGSNYFMLNTIVRNEVGNDLSKVAGIPKNWNKSAYNKKAEALNTFDELISNLDSKYTIISYSNEGFISLEEMKAMLSKYGNYEVKGIDYVTFRGSRNLSDRNKHTTEYLFTLEKK